ncbi:MAG TPA: endonuclease domain-containing protein, partial [Rudaea sp.]
MNALADPRRADAFRFVRRSFNDGVAELVYAFDEGPELIERIEFPDAPLLASDRTHVFDAALTLLHLIAGVSYYKAGVPGAIRIESAPIDAETARFLDEVYLHGLAEFAYQNKLDLRGRIRFPAARERDEPKTASFYSPRRTLVPIGGGKDSLVSVEMLRSAGEPMTAVWIGDSALIAACAQRTGLPTLNLKRRLAPELFEYNRLGAWNGHIPVTAINSAILACAAVLYGFDAIA